MEKQQHKLYFPGLNALRFFAATMVIFHHVEQYKSWAGIPNVWGNPITDSMGHKAVSFFFVLSGFLITYLLLEEHRKTQTIALKKFYMRRILRIWPLYFLIVLIAVALMPVIGQGIFTSINSSVTLPVLFCFVLFIPNVLRLFSPTIVGANQLWSVGIEEQFYVFWPLLIGLFVKRVVPFLLGFIFVKMLIHMGLLMGISVIDSVRFEQIERLYALFPVEQMAIGGLGAALLFHQKEDVLKYFRRKGVFVMSLIGILIISLSDSHFFLLTYLEAVLFTLILLNVIHYAVLYRPLEHQMFLHLGNISYGIYMWHTAVIAALLVVTKKLDLQDYFGWNLAFYSLSVVLTLVISHFSYTYFEKPFLKMKDRLSFVPSVQRKPA